MYVMYMYMCVSWSKSGEDLSSSTEETPLLVKSTTVRERVDNGSREEEVDTSSSWGGECSKLLKNCVAQGIYIIMNKYISVS